MRISDWSSDVCSSDLTQGIRVSMGRSMPSLANTRCLKSSGPKCCCGVLGTHVSHAPPSPQHESSLSLPLLSRPARSCRYRCSLSKLIETMLQPDGALHHLADRRTLLLHCSHTLMLMSEALCDCELARLEVGEFHCELEAGEDLSEVGETLHHRCEVRNASGLRTRGQSKASVLGVEGRLLPPPTQ